MLNSEHITTSEPFKFRDDKYTLLFAAPKTNKDFLSSRLSALITETKFLVLTVSNSKSSKTVIALSFALIVKADFLAIFFNFLFIILIFI